MHVGESGVTFYFNAGYDMSSNTALQIDFTAPTGGTSFVVTKLTSPAVTLETGANNVTVDGVAMVFAANEHVSYVFDVGEIDIAGTWTARLTYTNTATTPDTVLKTDPETFTVEA